MYLLVFHKNLILCVFLVCAISLFAQKYNNIDPVNYLQLPTMEPEFSKAEVFIQADKSAQREMMGKGLGKLSLKSESKTINLDDLVVNVFADKVEKYADWNLIDLEVALATGNDVLKVVVVYTPDDSSRPMAEPIKNNMGNHQFSYRVASKMRIYDAAKKLLLEKDFGAISGTGEAKSWPKGGGGSVDLLSLGSAKEEETANLDEMHPYEVACIEGAMEHAKRVLYGLYGARKFDVPLGVYNLKGEKDSKKYVKIYEDILKGKNRILLNQNQEKQMQDCVSWWEGVLPNAANDDLWAVHYNLAVGYAWLLDETKSQFHISKVKELNADRFDRIINKSGNFSGKDIDVLEAYNLAEPFASYFAKGINKYPNIPALLDTDVYTVSHVMAINKVIAGNLDLPFVLPIFPYEPKNTTMKKCDGAISRNGEAVLEFSYKLNKGDLEAVSLKGAKNSYLKKLNENVTITDKSELHPSEMNRLFYSFGSSKTSGVYSVSPEVEFRLNFTEYTNPFIIEPFKMSGDLSDIKTTFGGGSMLAARFTNKYFIESMSLSGKEWFSSEFVLGDSAHITIGAKPYLVSVKASETENGMPGKYEATYSLTDSNIGLFAKIKTKFGETTNSEQTRRLRAQTEMQPKIDKLMAETIKANGGKADGKNITLTKTYDCSYKVDDKGNWIEMTVGDVTVTRSIKY